MGKTFLNFIVGFCTTSIIGAVVILAPIISSTTPKSMKTTTTEMMDENKERTEEEVEYEDVAYESSTVNDSSLEYGTKKTKTKGKNGKKAIIYEVKYKGSKEISRTKKTEKIIEKPTDEVIAVGTKIIWHCVDTTSYNKNPYDDNYCKSSEGEGRYVSDSQAMALDPSYTPGKAGHSYYNSF